jgi:branched-chain amino acid transport system substrate-binding protein
LGKISEKGKKILHLLLISFFSVCISANANADGVKFGFMIGYTGDYAAWAPPLDNAAKLAVEEINSAGGVNGEKVELIIEDNLSTIEGSVKGARKLIDVHNVPVIVGPESDPLVAIIQMARDNKVPVITSSAGTQAIDKEGGTGKYIYRVNASDSFLGVAYAKVMLETLGKSKIGLFVENLEGTMSAGDTFTRNYERFGGEIVKTVKLTPGSNSYYNELAEMDKSGVDTVLIAAGQTTGVTFFKQMYSRGYDWTICVTTDLQTDDFVAGAGNEATQDVFALVPGQVDSEESWQRFSELYEAKFGEEPVSGYYQAETYDAIMVTALAMQASGGLTGEGVDENMIDIATPGGTMVRSFADGVKELASGNDIDYHGASGNVNYNEFGNAGAPAIRLLKVDNGEWMVSEVIDSGAFPPS